MSRGNNAPDIHNRTTRIGAADYRGPYFLALGGDERVMESYEYLNLILVPVAEVFRSRFPHGKAPFHALRNGSSCRVKFTGVRLEREWRQFCEKHELKNDSSLEY